MILLTLGTGGCFLTARQCGWHCSQALRGCHTMFPALKAFFLSQQKPTIVIKKFFENDFSEIYLWHMHSLVSVFHTFIQQMEKENNSIMEVKKILSSIHNILLERKSNNLMSLKKIAEMYLVKAVTSFVLICKACTMHVWSIWRSG